MSNIQSLQKEISELRRALLRVSLRGEFRSRDKDAKQDPAIKASVKTNRQGVLAQVLKVEDKGIEAGEGTVVIDKNGITILAGDGTANFIQWTDGAYLYSDSNFFVFSPDDLRLDAIGQIILSSPTGGIALSSVVAGVTVTGPLSVSGNVTLSGLPTSDPAVAGRLWNDAGTLKISA